MAGLRELMLFLLLTLAWGVMSQDPPPPVYRLPSTISPRLYMIQLDPDMDTGVVKGSIKIEINTTSDQTQPLNSITLHMGSNVMVNETTAIIVDTSGFMQKIGALIYDDDNTLLILQLPEGKNLSYNHMYVISLQFQTALNSEPKGLFTGFFNSTSKYVATNLRPTSARDVFPCFDEPQFKVPVALQVWRPDTHYAISTAPLVSSSVLGSKVLDTFENTEPISIHSLGLFIGQQLPIESMGVMLVVPPSLNISVPYLNNLISTIPELVGPYPHQPLYLIVLPDRTYTSFSSLGFVYTSPEVYLGEVGSPLQWTSLQLQLTEEFLRQYLEYTKTPLWWSELWLSESVGAFLSVVIQQNEPWLQDWLKIVIRSEALGSYTSPSGPVITTPDLTKWDIENIINNQTVKVKGLSTLLMWNATMPKGLVLKTLKEFVKLKQSIVSTSDLVSVMVKNMKANTTYDVTPAIPLLPNWVTQPGSPLVWFSSDSNSTFSLVQGTPCSAGSSSPALRSISIAVAVGSNPDWENTLQGRWLLNASSLYTYVNISQSSVINIETAPYRVNYPVPQWSTLAADLASQWAPAAVASALQDDAIAFSLGGCLDFSTALAVLNSTQHTSLDWWPVVKTTEAITAYIGDDSYGLSAYGLYFASLFTPDLLDQLDVRNSANHSELSVARELVTPWLCRFNISTCRSAVTQLGTQLWQGNTSGIAGSDLENVACYGARYTPGALEPLITAYQSAGNAWLRQYYTIALSCLTEQDSVSELLNIIINNTASNQTTLIQGDPQQILIGLASSMENFQTIVNFILSHGLQLQESFGVNTLSSVIKNLAKNRNSLSQLSPLQNNSDLDQYVKQSIGEAIATSTSIQSWFSSYNKQLYQALPAGEYTTTSTSASTSTTTTTNTPAPSSTAKPAPGAAPAISDCRVLTLALLLVLITLDFIM